MTIPATAPPGSPQATSSTSAQIPPLESGDHLTRAEFERRYEAMPHVKKAELIEGVVYKPSPVRINHHASPHAVVVTWLGTYWASTPGVQVGADGTVRLDLENEPQPDACMFVLPKHGGRVTLSSEDYIEGAPELVVEIAASTAAIDLHTKLRVYRRNAIQEYLVWRVLDNAIDWFVLRGTQYDRFALNSAGLYQSEVFPGLWLDPAALLALDLATVLRVVQQGLASPEHAAFVTRLQQAAIARP